MILVLDNRDSFTFNLVQALAALGAEVEVQSSANVSVGSIRALSPAGVLVGPGPGTPERAGASLDVIRELAGELPILGVCLGHQAIGVAFGGRIRRAPSLVHGRAVQVEHDGKGLFDGLPSPLPCTRYNSLTLDEELLPDCLEVSARSADGDLMALRHRTLDLEGVQFHPESIRSEGGEKLLANWLARTMR